MSSIKLKIDGLDDLRSGAIKGAKNVKNYTKKAMVASTNVVKNDAQKNAPYKTGTLRRSIFTDIQDNGFRGIVAQDGNIASYGIHLEYGTKPHDIYPVSGKALFWKGALNPYRRVHHPGFAARPYMFPALESNQDNIKRFFGDALKATLKDIKNG